MPQFGFTPVKKASSSKKSSSPSSKYNILFKDVEGVVFITLEGVYKVHVGDSIYNIAPESYSCKGVSEIYELALTDDIVRVRHIRSDRDRSDRDRSMYLPFTAGCSVKGNVVVHANAGSVYFKIRKTIVDTANPIAKQAIKYYRDNYKIITNAIQRDMIDNYEVEDVQSVNADVMDGPGI